MTMLSLPLDSEASDPRLLRQALGRFATGVTVITTRGPDGKFEGLTANSFSAVSLASFKEAGYFVVNVLSTAQSEVSRHFATPRHDKFEDVEFSTGIGGCPMFDESLAIFECRTESTIEGGDHVIFIGRVIQAHYRDGEPLIFAAGRYGTHAPLEDS
jgi:flavin reductase (DIM6/NTAB) family NADH-FMN oxidoreductase RutF